MKCRGPEKVYRLLISSDCLIQKADGRILLTLLPSSTWGGHSHWPQASRPAPPAGSQCHHLEKGMAANRAAWPVRQGQRSHNQARQRAAAGRPGPAAQLADLQAKPCVPEAAWAHLRTISHRAFHNGLLHLYFLSSKLSKLNQGKTQRLKQKWSCVGKK